MTRWLSRLRPDPLRRLHLDPGSSGPVSGPGASGTQRAQVANALRDLVAHRSATVAGPWRASVTAAVERTQHEVSGQLDIALRTAVQPSVDRPKWWAAVRAVQLLFLLLAIAGAVWLAVLAGFAYLRLPGPDFHVGRAPLPTLLLFGGLLLGVLTSVLVRPFVAVGAGRRRARARRSIDGGVREVARRCIIAPLTTELEAAAAFCSALAQARR